MQGAGQNFQISPTNLALPSKKGNANRNHECGVLKDTNAETLERHELEFQARLQDLKSEASSVSAIAFSLPKADCTAGVVLQHSVNVIERIFAKYDPVIFKVGFTHNPLWRWTSHLYGYCFAGEKWSDMIVFYASREACGPAMLEAALIEKYKSAPVAFGFARISSTINTKHCKIDPVQLYIYVYTTTSSVQQNCVLKNRSVHHYSKGIISEAEPFRFVKTCQAKVGPAAKMCGRAATQCLST